MTITAYHSSILGVDKDPVSEGLGASAFSIQTVTPQASGRVLVQFSADLLVDEEAQRNVPAFGLDPNSYQITNQITSARVGVVQVIPVSADSVLLLTSHTEAVSHQLRVSHVWDVYGNVIGGGVDTALFTGSPPVYPSDTELITFQGGMGGMGTELSGDEFLPDLQPPQLQNQNPAPGATGVAQGTNIVLEIVDPTGGTGLNEASVILTVDGSTAWQNDAQQAGYAVTKTPVTGGFQYTINPDTDLPESNQIVIGVYAEDNEAIPNVLNTSYNFTTFGTAPVIQNRSPAPGETDVDAGANVYLELVDPETGIDPASVSITVNGVLAFASQANQNGFVTTVNAISGGYSYSVDAPGPLPPGSAIIAVQADNQAEIAGSLNTNYSFTVFADVTPPYITSVDPAPNAEDVPPTQAVAFTLGDDSQVDLSQTTVYVRGSKVYDGPTGLFATGWTGSQVTANGAVNGYDFLLLPGFGLEWSPGEEVQVRVSTQDSSGLSLNTIWVFTAGGIAFPFSLSRMITQGVRTMDRRSPGLLELIATLPGGLDDVWQARIHDRIGALPDLLDPELIPDQWLPWLKSIVGFTRDLSFQATETELRQIIANAVAYWQRKPTEPALSDAIRMVTGNRFRIRNYFDFRMASDKTVVGELLEDFDPNVLDFPTTSPQGSGFSWQQGPGSDVYPGSHTFFITDLPESIFPNGTFRTVDQFIYLEVLDFPADRALEKVYPIQSLSPGNTSGIVDASLDVSEVGAGQTGTGKWRLWGGQSDFLTEVRLVDEPSGLGVVNRDLLAFLMNLVRPFSERIDVVYIAFLDQFLQPRDVGQWQQLGGQATTVPSPGGHMLFPADSLVRVLATFTDSWAERSVIYKLVADNNVCVARLYFVYVDTNNSYFLEVDYSSGDATLYRRVAGANVSLGSFSGLGLYPGVSNTFRLEYVETPAQHEFRFKFNGEKLIDAVDATKAFSTGTIGLASAIGGAEFKAELIEVMTLPATVERVGPEV